MARLNKIEQFIKDNDLDFSGYESDLNGNCVVLAGYALYIGIEDYNILLSKFNKTKISDNTELERVFSYAYNNNYGDWWNTEEAKKKYKF